MLARAPLLVVLLLSLAQLPALATGADSSTPGGAFTCDFAIGTDVPVDQVPPTIERDRMYMAERPGMIHKHVPLRPDPASGTLLTGGRYLFDTYADAQEYLRWMREDFALDGVLFLERPEFIDPDCHAWRVVGAAEMGDVRDAQVLLRTERWVAPAGDHDAFIAAQWPGILAEARGRGLSAVWLLDQPDERLVTVVSFAPRLLPVGLDPGLALLEAAQTLAPAFDDAGWAKTLDRTHWTLTIWFPYEFADSGEASLWPSSPPLPQPGPTDGVCEPSRGEDHATAPDDCTARCGDGIADPEETTRKCPSDVRLE